MVCVALQWKQGGLRAPSVDGIKPTSSIQIFRLWSSQETPRVQGQNGPAPSGEVTRNRSAATATKRKPKKAPVNGAQRSTTLVLKQALLMV